MKEQLAARGFAANGALHVEGINLYSEIGPITLKGMSTYGMQWQPQFASKGCVQAIKKRGANLLRVAMYTDEGGYIENPSKLEAATIAAVDTAVSLDMYAIIDWHILRDNNPMMHLERGKAFFDRAAARFAGCGAVLYEICNEPNGAVTWKEDVRPYAQEIIPVIRAQDPGAVVIVGTPTWSQDVDEAANFPLDEENILYACHFYAGTHGDALRSKIDYALSKGTPIFVSEWGMSRADGNGGVFIKEAEEWLAFLDARGISWANWSLGDKDESSAALRPGAPVDGNWSEKDLSASGQFVFSKFHEYSFNVHYPRSPSV